MSTYKPYPKYKDSGIEWLGKVPEHWDITSLKQLAVIKNGKDYKEVEVEEKGFPVIGSGGEFARASKYLFNGESVLLGRKGTINKPLYINGAFWTVDTMFYSEINPNVSGKYLFYCCLTINFDRYSTNTAVPSMTQEALGQIKFAIPQLIEQQSIAAFLDRETSRIDTLIQEQRELIELLKEKRQALISHAITKGLNPKVKMKDSGIEWIGEVPEHWSVKKITYLFRTIGSGTTPKSDNSTYYDNGTTPWVNTGDLNDSTLESCEKLVTDKALADFSSLKLFDANSIIIAMYGATIGKLSILKFPATVNQACCVFSDPIHTDIRFIFFWLLAFRQPIISLATGGGQPNISQEILRGLRLHYPPLQEQKNIADFLASELIHIDSLISEAESVIVLMQERRSSLISEAVTGKINVHIATATVADHKANSYFKRAVLAAEIASRMHEDFTFGRMKFQKLLYMCEHHLDFDLEGHYERYAAGPFDHKMMNSVESELQNQHWFQAVDTGKGHHYKPLPKAGAHKEYFQQYWSTQSSQFENLMNLFRPMTSEQAGIVATLYAVWNDFLIQGLQPSHEQIVDDVLTNWNDSKKKIARERWFKALPWMIEKQIIPHGSGRLTKKRGTTK